MEPFDTRNFMASLSCIYNGRNFAGQVGLSGNHYLGIYAVATVTDYWKVEPLEPWVLRTGQALRCNLRDALGHRVGIYLGAYLTTGASI